MAALLPQESEHRRDVVRDYLRHRERMYRLRRELPRQQAQGDRMTAPSPAGWRTVVP
ncbi:hypothetical protein ACNPQM_43870 [Streptomyces sp. NPDC056231]|uniref:hypothetical protein n=1 Tax=Streptomyces sp. NPDC056231 TaxID=3345755 RepID=UPI003AB00255